MKWDRKSSEIQMQYDRLSAGIELSECDFEKE